MEEIESDVDILLECIKSQKNDHPGMKRSLEALASIFNSDGDSKEYFRKVGGLHHVHKLLFTPLPSTVLQAAVYCLACAVENDVFCQNAMTKSETFSFLHQVFQEKKSLKLMHAAVFFLLNLVAGNSVGQQLAKGSMVINDMLDIFRDCTKACQMDYGIAQAQKDLWSSVVTTLSMCVNNPQNDVNQRVCSTILPHCFQILAEDQWRDLHGTLLSFAVLTVSGNSFNQNRVRKFGGLDSLLQLVHRQESEEQNVARMQTAVAIINVIDACIADNKENARVFLGRGGVQMVIRLMSQPVKLSTPYLLQLILTLGHALEHADRDSLSLSVNDHDVLVRLLMETEDEEMMHAIKYVLKTFQNQEKQEDESEQKARKPDSPTQRIEVLSSQLGLEGFGLPSAVRQTTWDEPEKVTDQNKQQALDSLLVASATRAISGSQQTLPGDLKPSYPCQRLQFSECQQSCGQPQFPEQACVYQSSTRVGSAPMTNPQPLDLPIQHTGGVNQPYPAGVTVPGALPFPPFSKTADQSTQLWKPACSLSGPPTNLQPPPLPSVQPTSRQSVPALDPVNISLAQQTMPPFASRQPLTQQGTELSGTSHPPSVHVPPCFHGQHPAVSASQSQIPDSAPVAVNVSHSGYFKNVPGEFHQSCYVPPYAPPQSLPDAVVAAAAHLSPSSCSKCDQARFDSTAKPLQSEPSRTKLDEAASPGQTSTNISAESCPDKEESEWRAFQYFKKFVTSFISPGVSFGDEKEARRGKDVDNHGHSCDGMLSARSGGSHAVKQPLLLQDQSPDAIRQEGNQLPTATSFGPQATHSVGTRGTVFEPQTTHSVDTRGTVFEPQTTHLVGTRGTVFEPQTTHSVGTRGTVFEPQTTHSADTRRTVFDPQTTHSVGTRGTVFDPQTTHSVGTRGAVFEPQTTHSVGTRGTVFEPQTTHSVGTRGTVFEPQNSHSVGNNRLAFEPQTTYLVGTRGLAFEPQTTHSMGTRGTACDPQTTHSVANNGLAFDPQTMHPVRTSGSAFDTQANIESVFDPQTVHSVGFSRSGGLQCSRASCASQARTMECSQYRAEQLIDKPLTCSLQQENAPQPAVLTGAFQAENFGLGIVCLHEDRGSLPDKGPKATPVDDGRHLLHDGQQHPVSYQGEAVGCSSQLLDTVARLDNSVNRQSNLSDYEEVILFNQAQQYQRLGKAKASSRIAYCDGSDLAAGHLIEGDCIRASAFVGDNGRMVVHQSVEDGEFRVPYPRDAITRSVHPHIQHEPAPCRTPQQEGLLVSSLTPIRKGLRRTPRRTPLPVQNPARHAAASQKSPPFGVDGFHTPDTRHPTTHVQSDRSGFSTKMFYPKAHTHASGLNPSLREVSAEPPGSPALSEFDCQLLKAAAANCSLQSSYRPSKPAAQQTRQRQSCVEDCDRASVRTPVVTKTGMQVPLSDVSRRETVTGSSADLSEWESSQETVPDSDVSDGEEADHRHVSLCMDKGCSSVEASSMSELSSCTSEIYDFDSPHPQEATNKDVAIQNLCPGCYSTTLNSRTFNIAIETSAYTCSAHRFIRQTERDYILAKASEMKLSRKLNFLQWKNRLRKQQSRGESNDSKAETKVKRPLHIYEFHSSDSDKQRVSPPRTESRPDEGGPRRSKAEECRRKARVPYTEEEVENLLRGVRSVGRHWTQLLHAFPFHPSRTAVDLKEKYQRLMRNAASVRKPLRPRTKSVLSMCEERRLKRGVAKFGHSWKTILKSSRFAAGRTAKELREKWRSMCKQ